MWSGRSRSRSYRVGLACVVCASVLVVAGLTPSGAAVVTPPLVVNRDVVDVYSSDPSGVRVDPFIVWICAIDPGGPVPPVALTAAEAADVLQTKITPYYEWLSAGAYRPEFTAGGSLPAGTNEAERADCHDAAINDAASAGFAGAVVITNAPVQNAFGQSGHKVACAPMPAPCTGSTTLPDNRRYMELGAQNVVATSFGEADFGTPAHEIGHTLDWGHAGPPPRYQADEQAAMGGMVDPQAPWLDDVYEGFVEVIDHGLAFAFPGLPGLAAARAALGPGDVDCATALPPDPAFIVCVPYFNLAYGDVTDVMGTTPTPLSADTRTIPQTQVFNRYAAGWVPDEDVEVFGGHGAVYHLAPIGVHGTQMVVLPTGNDQRYFTIEARADSPFLGAGDLRPGAQNTGVLLHVVDQESGACGNDLCWGDTNWKTMMAQGTPWTFDHVLGVGQSATVEGVPVQVVSLNADGTYTVQVGEVPEPLTPAAGPVVPAAPVATPAAAVPSFTG